jgi:hypothetical protein
MDITNGCYLKIVGLQNKSEPDSFFIEDRGMGGKDE